MARSFELVAMKCPEMASLVTRCSELVAMKCLEMSSFVTVSVCTTVRCGCSQSVTQMGKFVTCQVTGSLTPWAAGRKVWP